MQGADCILIHAILQKGLSVCGLWHLQGVLEPIPHGGPGTTKFWGSQRLHADFGLCGALSPVLFRDQLCIASKTKNK